MKKITFLLLGLFFFQFSIANGVLIVDKTNGTYLNLTDSNVNVNVRNQVATIISTQKFVNGLGGDFEVEYGFPMPKSGTATKLRWRINNSDTWFVADFSVQDPDTSPGGGDGSTTHPNLTQYLGETPLLFSIIQTIPDNATIEMEITYVQLLEYSFDKVTFEYPSDYSLIQPTIIENSQKINFNLFSERSINSIEMTNQTPTVTNDGQNAIVELIEYESVSIENIEIIYELASDELGIISFSTFLPDGSNECDDLGNGFLGMVIEPESNPNTAVIQKSFTLVIDKSGSMQTGNKIGQAKDAASFIVNNLNFGDTFNIIAFSSSVDRYKDSPVEFNSTTQTEALQYISTITAGGGTNISESLTSSINQLDIVNDNNANIIVFFTDGQATSGETSTDGILNNVQNAVNANETNIFLFTFGIGDNVTKDLLTRLGSENNGFAQFLEDNEIEDVISEFYLTIRNPVLLNPEITFTPDIITDIYPSPLPNLYKGQQLILNGRYETPQDISVTLSGKAFNQNVNYTYDISLENTSNETNSFLPKLWAKTKIESLTTAFFSLPEDSAEAELIKEEIEEISLCYQVLSQFTSFQDGSLSIEEFFDNQQKNNLAFYPNPFTDKTSAKINLKSAQEFTIYIYDINGKLIKTIIVNGSFGNNLITWDGSTDDGQIANSGIYIYQVDLKNNNQLYGKIVKQ